MFTPSSPLRFFLYRAKLGTSMRKEIFTQGEYYHIYNRGVDKRIVFTNDEEKRHFVNTLYVLNNFLEIPPRFNVYELEPRELLTTISPHVEITAGCIMDNHYHLMARPLQENGISRFLHKIGTSHSHYFNKRHERSGRLFESTFKAKHVDRHEYAAYLTQYVHLNPVDLYRAKHGTDEKEILRRVKEYPWSSLPIYLGKESPFSLIVSPNFRDTVLGQRAEEYGEFLKEVYDEVYQA